MRIVSLVPSATEIVFALGLGDDLVGRSADCDYPPEAADVPVVTAPSAGRDDETSREIDARVRGQVARGRSLYRLDREALGAAAPDLILTQELCEVCAVSYGEVVEAVRELASEAEIVSLEPSSVEGILNSITTVGAMTEAEDEAIGLVELLRERLARIENQVLERRLAGVPPRRVVCLEWLDPPFAAGHWVPEQVRRAGGWDLLGREGERSAETTWEQVREVDPEQLFLMPCGFDARRARDEWEALPKPAFFGELRAVRARDVIALDGSSYFSRPGPRVVDGIGILAELMDPSGLRDLAPDEAWIPVLV
jgi:iron complex transport system substrate-binding protein